MFIISVITCVFIKEDISLITINGVLPGNKCITEMLSNIAASGILIDMINYSTMPSKDTNFSFSVLDNDLPKVLPIVGSLKSTFPIINTDVSSRNTKFRFYSDNMASTEGVASSLLHSLDSEKVEIKLITTSDNDISVLVDGMSAESVVKLAVETYGAKLNIL